MEYRLRPLGFMEVFANIYIYIHERKKERKGRITWKFSNEWEIGKKRERSWGEKFEAKKVKVTGRYERKSLSSANPSIYNKVK